MVPRFPLGLPPPSFKAPPESTGAGRGEDAGPEVMGLGRGHRCGRQGGTVMSQPKRRHWTARQKPRLVLESLQSDQKVA